MKKDVLKKIIIAFSLISITIADTETLNAIEKHDPHFAYHEQDKQFLDDITAKIESFVVFSSKWMNQFLNKANHESYNTHVDRFQIKLAEFNKTVIHALQNHHTTTYIEVIKTIKNIVTILYTKANDVCDVFNQYRGKDSAISLGLALQKATNKYSAKQLENQLLQVQQLLRQIDGHLANKVTRIITLAKKQEREINSRSSMEVLGALRHRVNCKGASTVVASSISTGAEVTPKAPIRTIAKTFIANRSVRIAQRRKRIAEIRARRGHRRKKRRR